MKNIKFSFNQAATGTTFTGYLNGHMYENGVRAVVMESNEGPVAVCTINPEDAEQWLEKFELSKEDAIFVKDYSENEGMYKSLLDAEIIHHKVAEVPCGYTSAKLCTLTDKGKSLFPKNEDYENN